MAKAAVHTVPNDKGGWKNVSAGSSRAIGTYRTKAEAQAAGRERAKQSRTEHIVHTRDGRIGARNSYGNDPRRSKG